MEKRKRGRPRKGSQADAGTPPPAEADERVFDSESGEEEHEERREEHHEEERHEEPEVVNFATDQHPEPEPEAAPQSEARRKYKKRGKKGEKEATSPENLTKILLSCHQMLAGLVGVPELLLNKQEAENMGQAIHEVEKLYVNSSWLNEEVSAWVNLGLTGVMIYWPRYMAIKRRMDAEAAKDIDVSTRPPSPIDMSRTGTGSVKM